MLYFITNVFLKDDILDALNEIVYGTIGGWGCSKLVAITPTPFHLSNISQTCLHTFVYKSRLLKFMVNLIFA